MLVVLILFNAEFYITFIHLYSVSYRVSLPILNNKILGNDGKNKIVMQYFLLFQLWNTEIKIEL